MADSGGRRASDDDAAQRASEVGALRLRFGLLAKVPDTEIDLAEGALLIAAEEYPGLDVPSYVAQLDALAERVRQRLAQLREPAPAAPAVLDADEAGLHALHTVLFEEEGFVGARRDAAPDPRHSFLNEVLDRKHGLPITLSVVYCEVARRAGLDAVGIALPGHFIAQYRGRHLSVYVDPFNGGTRLEREECADLLRRIFGSEFDLRPEHFLPASRRAILTRILDNLKVTYFQRGQLTKALSAVERILILHPAPASTLHQVRDRGLILRQMGLLLVGGGARRDSGTTPAGGRVANIVAGWSAPSASDQSDLLVAMQFFSAAWFDLKLYAREAEGQPDAGAVRAAAETLWRQMGKQN